MKKPEYPQSLVDRLLEIGSSLSSQRDINALLEMILEISQQLANADGGTLYRVTDDQHLKFEILRNTTLGMATGGPKGGPITIPPMPLFEANGEPVLSKVATFCVHRDKTVNIEDAYTAQEFDFSGTRAMDAKLGYRSQSILAVPMKNHEGEIIGVLQLINAKDPSTGSVRAFNALDQQIIESLASQAAVALTNRLLIIHLEELFESFISMINHAIDDKSPYTAGHCARVPELTMLIAQAVNKVNYGPLKDFHMSEKDEYELKIAGLLHDCGKVTTPVHVVDKGTKLETIFDRIHLLDTRFEIAKRDLQIACLKGELNQAQLGSRLEQLDADRAFIRKTNVGGEFMKEEDIARVKEISKRYPWVNQQGELVDFLSDEEIKNLTIRAGTLTTEERQIINHHIDVTIDMLEQLPWPKHLRNVPEYAGGHHERMDGKGYPRGLTREQMSVQARCMGIADIFEALTARDRPYKKGKTLSESLNILGKMRLDHHVDPDLFNIFIWEKVYMKYAEKFLEPAQIDEVDVVKIPGYEPPPAPFN
jgi:HD-GYP domain-containing protein (c-di-GMP phosphodiesterase class II)